MTDCYKESYEDHIKNTDFLENKLYLEDKTCCDADSCEKLSMDYQELMHKCHDVYGKDIETNEKGFMKTETICDRLEEKRDKFNLMSFSKWRGGYNKRNSKNSSRKSRKNVRFSIKSPKSRSRGGKTTKKKNNKTQNRK
jgi:hypothetical protein